MNEPVKLSWMYRPPSTHLFSETPVETIGGCPGVIHEVTLASNVPTMPSSALWPAPGVANFCHASIMAFSSADISFCANVGAAQQTRTRARVTHTLSFM